MNLIEGIYAFQKKKTYSRSTPWTAGSNLQTCGGSFGKLPAETVPMNIGRWIDDERLEIDQRERESGQAVSSGGGAMARDGETSSEFMGIGLRAMIRSEKNTGR